MRSTLASLSLDLDNKWSYLKTHGNSAWEALPSYLDLVVPRILDIFAARGLTITFFIVGQDCALPEHEPTLCSIADAGHEIGNHSFHHEPWLHLYDREQLETEIACAEGHIERVTGQRPVGFRGPGYSVSPATFEVLAQRGYLYDASTLPTFLGPVARLVYFVSARLTPDQKQDRKRLFGTFSDGFRPLKPFWCESNGAGGRLLEIPVTTMPLLRLPIHLSYVHYLAKFSVRGALAYFRNALRLCRVRRIEPSILLHPLDFLGVEDDQELAFFPAMSLPLQRKLDVLNAALDELQRRCQVVTMRQHYQHHHSTEPDRPSDRETGETR